MMSARNLNAYYYSFKATGAEAVDGILEAVASAGHACHDTAEWSDGDEGSTPVDIIQAAADAAANAFLSSAKEPQIEGWRHRSEAAKDTDLTTGTKVQIKRPSGNVTECSVGSQMWQMCLRYDDEMLAYRIATAAPTAPSSEGGEKPVGAYPEGVTSADHLASDMASGIFPARSSMAEFLARAVASPKPLGEALGADIRQWMADADRIAQLEAELANARALLSQPEHQGGEAVGNERAKYEAWARVTGFTPARRPDGEYVSSIAKVAWKAWQAALKSGEQND